MIIRIVSNFSLSKYKGENTFFAILMTFLAFFPNILIRLTLREQNYPS